MSILDIPLGYNQTACHNLRNVRMVVAFSVGFDPAATATEAVYRLEGEYIATSILTVTHDCARCGRSRIPGVDR